MDKKNIGVDVRLLGFAALSNFGKYCSSSRFVMFTNQLSQHIPLDHGDSKIVLSGVENEYRSTLFGRSAESNIKVLGLVNRYRSVVSDVSIDTVTYLMYIDLESSVIEYMAIPKVERFSQKFGFRHRISDIISDLYVGDVVEKGTRLSRTNSEDDEGNLRVGLTVNMCLGSFKEVGEDAIIISESLSKRGSFKTYETHTTQFGDHSVPLNIYGGPTQYKIMPDIGERIRDDGLIFATRDIEPALSPATMSTRALMSPRPLFDKCIYTDSGDGTVIDIRVIHSPKRKRTTSYSLVSDQAKKYADAMLRFNDMFLSTAERIQSEYSDIEIGPMLHKKMVDLYGLRDPKIQNVKNQIPLDVWYVEIDIEYTNVLGVGVKMAGLYGDKGEVAEVRPDHHMPVDENGVMADAMMDHKSVASRLNPGKLYDGHIAASSRWTRRKILKMLDVGSIDLHHHQRHRNKILEIWGYILKYLKIFNTVQYKIYSTNHDITIMVEVLLEIVNKELYLVFPIDNPKSAYDIAIELEGSGYEHPTTRITWMTHRGYTTSDEPIPIHPAYMLVLSKISDDWLATSTAKANHFGTAITTSRANKTRQPGSPNPVRTGETETRLYTAYAKPGGISELRMRSSSIETHKAVHRKILESETPTNIERLVDPETASKFTDGPVDITRAILNVGGADIGYHDSFSEEGEK